MASSSLGGLALEFGGCAAPAPKELEEHQLVRIRELLSLSPEEVKKHNDRVIDWLCFGPPEYGPLTLYKEKDILGTLNAVQSKILTNITMCRIKLRDHGRRQGRVLSIFGREGRIEAARKSVQVGLGFNGPDSYRRKPPEDRSQVGPEEVWTIERAVNIPAHDNWSTECGAAGPRRPVGPKNPR